MNQSDRKMLEIVKNAYHGFDTEREMGRLTEKFGAVVGSNWADRSGKKPLTELSASDKLI